MTNEEKLIDTINKIKNIASKGLKDQLMRGDRSNNQSWTISIRIANKIVDECKGAVK